jgi:hypothetical protein
MIIHDFNTWFAFIKENLIVYNTIPAKGRTYFVINGYEVSCKYHNASASNLFESFIFLKSKTLLVFMEKHKIFHGKALALHSFLHQADTGIHSKCYH